jgi:hypothetical protein
VGASRLPEQEDLAWRERRSQLVEAEHLVEAGVGTVDGEPRQHRGTRSGPHHRQHRFGVPEPGGCPAEGALIGDGGHHGEMP